jgi:ABC-2 type transport system ATP-binding protein
MDIDNRYMISARDLTRRYGSILAVDAITVDVEPGTVGLVGSNGAGKSTLLKLLLGLLTPSSGAASVLGFDCATQGDQIRARVGYMPEHDCLPPDVSATEFVVHMARMSGLPAAAARERAADTLRHVGLHEERYRPIGEYSTGMRQRVKLAQALVHDPQLVLLDEPTNGLDPAGRDEMLGLIQRIGTEFGISVLVTSHLLGELERVCDSLVVIDAGRLLRYTRTADVTGATPTVAIEVEGDPGVLVAALERRGLAPVLDGRIVEIDPGDEAALDAIRDDIDDLDLGLVRLERRRHRMVELFAPEEAS